MVHIFSNWSNSNDGKLKSSQLKALTALLVILRGEPQETLLKKVPVPFSEFIPVS